MRPDTVCESRSQWKQLYRFHRSSLYRRARLRCAVANIKIIFSVRLIAQCGSIHFCCCCCCWCCCCCCCWFNFVFSRFSHHDFFAAGGGGEINFIRAQQLFRTGTWLVLGIKSKIKSVLALQEEYANLSTSPFQTFPPLHRLSFRSANECPSARHSLRLCVHEPTSYAAAQSDEFWTVIVSTSYYYFPSRALPFRSILHVYRCAYVHECINLRSSVAKNPGKRRDFAPRSCVRSANSHQTKSLTVSATNRFNKKKKKKLDNHFLAEHVPPIRACVQHCSWPPMLALGLPTRFLGRYCRPRISVKVTVAARETFEKFGNGFFLIATIFPLKLSRRTQQRYNGCCKPNIYVSGNVRLFQSFLNLLILLFQLIQ